MGGRQRCSSGKSSHPLKTPESCYLIYSWTSLTDSLSQCIIVHCIIVMIIFNVTIVCCVQFSAVHCTMSWGIRFYFNFNFVGGWTNISQHNIVHDLYINSEYYRIIGSVVFTIDAWSTNDYSVTLAAPNGHPSTADTHDVTDTCVCPDCISILKSP